mmetsp:Transcript_120512/g.346223  ORF Transcript_120512/g.346223 Transcript_120512/m.346223 type:complete len:208 (-) Transcript_120512:101-724(-)
MKHRSAHADQKRPHGVSVGRRLNAACGERGNDAADYKRPSQLRKVHGEVGRYIGLLQRPGDKHPLASATRMDGIQAQSQFPRCRRLALLPRDAFHALHRRPVLRARHALGPGNAGHAWDRHVETSPLAHQERHVLTSDTEQERRLVPHGIQSREHLFRIRPSDLPRSGQLFGADQVRGGQRRVAQRGAGCRELKEAADVMRSPCRLR